ncbi:MAG: hypothetical protein E5X11_01450 [Mesorhizobium sp.]|nr:MAG: hypothetical protein E5X11_01450 [Mesorhizobium sp.]
MASNLVNDALEACRSAIAGLKDRTRSETARRKFWALGPEECTGMLNDIGMSTGEFDDDMHLPYALKDFLTLAMLSVGIDPDSFHTLEFMRDGFMSRTCITCPHRRSCHNHLEAFDFESHYRDFCPNKDNFSKLLAKRYDA